MGHLRISEELYEPKAFERKCPEIQSAASSPQLGMEVPIQEGVVIIVPLGLLRMWDQPSHFLQFSRGLSSLFGLLILWKLAALTASTSHSGVTSHWRQTETVAFSFPLVHTLIPCIHAVLACDNSSLCGTQTQTVLLTNREWNPPVLADSWVRE